MPFLRVIRDDLEALFDFIFNNFSEMDSVLRLKVAHIGQQPRRCHCPGINEILSNNT